MPSHIAAWKAVPRKEIEQRRKKAQQAMAESRWVRAHGQLSVLVEGSNVATIDLEAHALVLQRLGRYDESWQIVRRLLAIDPASFKAARLGTAALIHQNRWAEAIELFDHHGDGPGRRDYSFVADHGAALAAMGRPQQAVQVLLEAMMLDCSDPALHMRLAHVLCDLKMFEESAESWLTAVKLDSGRLIARLMLLHMRQRACQWASYAADCEELIAALTNGSGAVIGQAEGGSFSLLSIEHPPALLKKVTKAVSMRRPAGFAPLQERRLATAHDRRLRIGYVSNDFYCHATALLMVEMLEHRNRQRFEVTLYSHSPTDGTPIESRIRAACEHFVDISALSDRDAAEQIRSDEIDILVDLKGQTAGNRLAIFAWRPAPLQVTFLGFPGTSGADFMDYVIGDRWVTPLAHADRYSEQIAQMPGCYQPNDSQRERPDPLHRSQFLLPLDKLVLGCFNQSYKITPATFDVWTDILKAVPNSVLWLLEDNAQATANLRREAQARGVDVDRLLFAPKLPVAFHLARLPLADLMLDNWPYNAHTTASDALWMGVPMVTLEGEGFASRVGGSLLRSVGLDELVCMSVDEYRDKVVGLLKDPSRLQKLRRRLTDGRKTLGLFDGARFADDIERLYERMAERAAAGLPACALEAEVSLPKAAVSTAHADAENGASVGMRVAVITPYFKESKAWIERCIESVRNQSFSCDHFLVADGHAQDWIDGVAVRHLRLDRSHADYGATPRALGAQLAISEGYDAIAFLDADNWFEPEHVETCLNARTPEADYVAAQRHWVRDDGSRMAVRIAEDDDGSHVDSNCFFLLRGAFHSVTRWLLMPKPMAVLGDRFYYASLLQEGLQEARTSLRTVNYLCTWSAIYRQIGEEVPDYAKDGLTPQQELQTWIRGLGAADLAQVQRLSGCDLQRYFGSHYPR